MPPPRKCEEGENIIFPHPSDAGGKKDEKSATNVITDKLAKYKIAQKSEKSTADILIQTCVKMNYLNCGPVIRIFYVAEWSQIYYFAQTHSAQEASEPPALCLCPDKI